MPTQQHVGLPPSEHSSTADLRYGVSDLAHRPGVMRRIERAVAVPGLAVGEARVPEGETVELDLRLEGVTEGLVVSGYVTGGWAAPCSRCLKPVEGPFDLEVHELFEDEPVEGETYRIDGEEIDLEPLVRDAVVLELPGAPVCDDDCVGLCPRCGIDRNQETCSCVEDTRDPRWSALEELRFDEP